MSDSEFMNTYSKSYYRPDIDGLRGLSIICVVLYHLFPDFFMNGFLGVDIFFVISGFVVTQALIKNLKSGRLIGLKIFYKNRMKRILPALYFNSLISILLCMLFISPSEIESIFKTAASSIFGLSNLALWYAGFDYFSSDISLNPFGHTWSLGIEEQFYAIFPFVVLLVTSIFYKKDYLKYFLIGATICSFIYWTYLRLDSTLIEAFYNPFARFWELLIGVLLYLYKDKINGFKVAFIFEVIVILIFTITIFHQAAWANSLFYNIVAVFFAVFFIATGDDSRLSILLKKRFMIYIGKISYSLYLWHFTVFVLFDWTIGLEHPLNMSIALSIVVAISIASYKYVETPFRQSNMNFSKVLILAISSGGMIILTIFLSFNTLVTYFYLGDSNQQLQLWPKENQPLGLALQATARDCHLEFYDTLTPNLFDKCRTLPKNTRVIFLIGNSHAQHLVPMLDEISNITGYGYTALTISGCRMLPAAKLIKSIDYELKLCRQYFEETLDYIESNSKPNDIVLFGYRSMLAKPIVNTDSERSGLLIDGMELSLGEAYKYSMDSLLNFSSLLRAKGVNLIFTGPTPVLEFSPLQCIDEWFRPKKNSCNTQNIFTNGPDPLQDQIDIFNYNIKSINKINKNAIVWYPHKMLCDVQDCPQKIGDVEMYRDEHHFSFLGSKMLASDFILRIKNL
jgi:peptidoglycan/LPS O-acetylase OafA/YrhL